jgi:hypothetical protein
MVEHLNLTDRRRSSSCEPPIRRISAAIKRAKRTSFLSIKVCRPSATSTPLLEPLEGLGALAPLALLDLEHSRDCGTAGIPRGDHPIIGEKICVDARQMRVAPRGDRCTTGDAHLVLTARRPNRSRHPRAIR